MPKYIAANSVNTYACKKATNNSKVIINKTNSPENIDTPYPAKGCISPNINTARKLQIMWGVHSCHNQDALNTEEMVSIACSVAKDKKIVMPGDSVVITAGIPFGNAGATNLLRIAKIIADKDLT